MKTIKYIGLTLLLLTLSNSSVAQCGNTKKLIDKCNDHIYPYKYQKDYEFYIPKFSTKDEVVYTLNMTRGVTYKFHMEKSKKFDNEPIINIVHKNRKFLIASSYDPNTEKCYESIEFECKTTATVEVKFTFKGLKEGCGVCVMGIKTD
jgi:hypothetical protein